MDVVIRVTDDDLAHLRLDKGIMHLVSHERQEEILSYLEGREKTILPGGSCPNTMLALAGFGIKSVVSGKIGNDDFGTSYESQVAAYGITSRLVKGNGPTGSSVILVTPDGERTMNTHLGMCQQFSAADIDEELLRTADYLYFTGYMWDTEVQKAAITRAIEICSATEAKVVFDVADPFAVERYRADFRALIKNKVDIAFANHREASILFGCQDAEDCARALGQDVEIGVLKTGKEGSIVSSAGSLTRTPGNPIQVVDTTGAGDMFAAGFLAGLALGQGPDKAAELAGHLAEAIITRTGAQFPVEVIRGMRGEWGIGRLPDASANP